MNEEQEAQRLAERFMGLPDVLQELFLSEEVGVVVTRLGDHYQIPRETRSVLMEEIGLVLLGEIRLENLKGRLLARLQLPQQRITNLVADLDKEIFSPVHHLLIPKVAEPATTTEKPSTPREGTSLADQVAQFQARKKQKEEEQKKLIPMSAPETGINPSSPNSLQ